MRKGANADKTGGHRTLQWRWTEPNDENRNIDADSGSVSELLNYGH